MACGVGVLPASGENNPAAKEGIDPLQLSLEELGTVKVDTVYGASKHDQKLTEAPSSVSLVTADEIKKFGHRTLADILRGVRDFYVTEDRNYGYTGVRGFNRPGDFGGRTLILVDGHRLNDPIFDSAFNLMEFILDVDMIERVEVIRGAGSSLYGNNAFFGVINVVTKRGRDIAGTEIAATAASFDTYQGRISYGNRLTNGVEIALSGSFFNSLGHNSLYFAEYDQPENNHGVARHADGEQGGSGLATVSWKDFTLQGALVSREKHVPTASFGTIFNDPRNRTTDTRGYVNLGWAHQFDESLELSAKAYYDHYRLDEYYPFAGANSGDPSVLNKDVAVSDRIGTEIQATREFFEKHRLTIGGEFKADVRLDQMNLDLDPVVTNLDSRRDAQSFGVFVQDEFSILPNLILNAGGRYDHFDFTDSSLSPRAALIYSPWKETSFKLLYGEAFRAPNMYERFYESPFQKPNENLRPENIRSYEGVWEQGLPAGHTLSLSGFHNQITHLISQERDPTDGMIYFGNLANATTTGLSLGGEGRYPGGWLVRVGYTLQRTEDSDTGQELSNSPRHLAKFGVVAPLYQDKLFSGLEVQYSGCVKTLAGATASDFFLVNWNLFSQKLVKGVEFSLGIHNLLDEKYANPGAEDHVPVDLLQQDGRTYRLKLAWKF